MSIINSIVVGNNIEVMKKMEAESIDFCFADPPYFLQLEEGKKLLRVEGKEYDGCNDDWDKFSSMNEYKDFTYNWLKEVRRVLRKNGTICLISGMQSIYEIGNILRELGFWIINDIVWLKSNPTPNFGGTRLNNSHETLIWAAKSKKSKFTFNYKTGKFLNNGKQMGSVWTFPVCSGKERLKDIENKKLHSTQKPEELLYRCIALFTKKGDIVLDPFGGTMTTGAVAKKTGRNFIMIEADKKYASYGQKRIDSVIPVIGDVENAIYDDKPPKVTMEEMTDNGYFVVGEYFYLNDNTYAVLADNKGKLRYCGVTDSMHEIAAKMQNRARRVNAFDYLYVKRNDCLVSINEIRKKYREEKK